MSDLQDPSGDARPGSALGETKIPGGESLVCRLSEGADGSGDHMACACRGTPVWACVHRDGGVWAFAPWR